MAIAEVEKYGSVFEELELKPVWLPAIPGEDMIA